MVVTPSGGVVRTHVDPSCPRCGKDLRNLAVYPHTGENWRCVNRLCQAASNYERVLSGGVHG